MEKRLWCKVSVTKLWTSTFLYRIHKTQPLHCSMRRIKLVQNAVPTSFKIHFNITLPLTHNSRKQSHPLWFSYQTFARFVINPTWGVLLFRLISLDLTTAVLFGYGNSHYTCSRLLILLICYIQIFS